MKFLPDGPDIPDELIAAQERGEVMFVCGAGVSMSLDLPSFKGLVERVYAALGEDWQLHHAEREGMVSGGKLEGQYDRVLRSLERRLAASNIGRASRMRARIRAAVRAALQPPVDPNVDLSNHAALLELSRDAEDALRLVTTNFDTLFERAWPRAGTAPSYSGAAMPQPKTAGCSGVLHLHGRLADQQLGLSDTDLVLTSAEFGDAYLRSGWASRYVYDLVRAYSVVLVGYQADDPPMRYLLEVLEADRERYPDLQQVYAFSSPGSDPELTEALWLAKGVRPILHAVEGGDYSPLWNTIGEWCTYQRDPTAWRREQLRQLLAGTPSQQTPEVLERVVTLLQHGDASQLLGELSPPAAWLPVLVERRVFDNEKASPAQWIASQPNEPAMIAASAGLHYFDSNTVWSVERAIERNRTELSAVRLAAWELILAAKRQRHHRDRDLRWYGIAKRVRDGTAGYDARQVIASLVRPRLTVQKPWRLYDDEPTEERAESLHTLIWLDFKTSDGVPIREILDAWPNEPATVHALIDTLDRTLNDALEHAEAVGFISGWDRSDGDVPSVADHPQNRYRRDFYPIIRLLADLWGRLLALQPDVARQLLFRWAGSRFTLFRRLALYAGATPALTPSELVEMLLGLDDHTFWVSGAQVEIMRALVSRWDEFALAERESIETRLRTGVPRALFEPDAFDEEDKWSSIYDDSIYRRFKRLEGAGKALSDASLTSVAEIAGRRPRWRPSRGDRDDFHSWSESTTGPEGNPELLKDITDDALVQEALRIQRERGYDQGDLWRKFCSSDPDRALRGLIAAADRNEFSVEAWRCLLWEVDEKSDDELQASLARQLVAMPEEPLRALLSTVSDWLRRKRDYLLGLQLDGQVVYWVLWDRFADLAYPLIDGEDATENNEDVASRALNAPGGVLSWTLVEALGAADLPAGSELLAPFQARFMKVSAADGEAGRLGRYHFARHTAYLDYIAPIWTGVHVVPMLRWQAPDARVMWESYSQGNIGSAQLFNSLRGDLVAALTSGHLGDTESGSLAGRLLQVIIWHQIGSGEGYELEAADLRRVLTLGPAEVRRHIAWEMWLLASKPQDPPVSKAEQWRGLLGPIFTSIWPLDARHRDEDISGKLVNMVLDTEEAFPEAVEAVIDVLVPFQFYSFAHTLRLEDKHADIHRAHPHAYLALANAIIDPALHPVPADLATVLAECVEADETVTDTDAYRRLYGLRRQAGA